MSSRFCRVRVFRVIRSYRLEWKGSLKTAWGYWGFLNTLTAIKSITANHSSSDVGNSPVCRHAKIKLNSGGKMATANAACFQRFKWLACWARCASAHCCAVWMIWVGVWFGIKVPKGSLKTAKTARLNPFSGCLLNDKQPRR